MGVYGIVVLSFFSSGISVILILMSSIAVSSSLAVYGFSSYWLTVFCKRRSFTVLHRFLTPYFGICQYFLRYFGIGYLPVSPSKRSIV